MSRTAALWFPLPEVAAASSRAGVEVHLVAIHRTARALCLVLTAPGGAGDSRQVHLAAICPFGCAGARRASEVGEAASACAASLRPGRQ